MHHPTIDSSINTLSSEVRAAGANRYAAAKDRRAHKTIKDKNLRIGFKAITFGSYGSFGTSTHLLINKATADAQQSVFNPWVTATPMNCSANLFRADDNAAHYLDE